AILGPPVSRSGSERSRSGDKQNAQTTELMGFEMVSRQRLELWTRGLKVRCSNSALLDHRAEAAGGEEVEVGMRTQYGLLAAGTGGDQGHRRLDLLLDEVDVVAGLLGEVRPFEDAHGRALPALEGTQHRLGGLQAAAVRREIAQGLAVQLVGDADGDLVEVVEHVELGQRHGADTVEELAVAGRHRVEPAAAPGPAGDGAELVAAMAQDLARGVRQLAGEGAAADARGVGLEQAHGAVDSRRRHAGARAGAA